MGLNNTAMGVAATALKNVLLYAQLHSAAAGSAGTSNVTTAARKSVSWSATTGNGDFGLASAINFTGGAANGPVYSVTLWSASTAGTFYGEFVIGGQAAFDNSGGYTLDSLNLDGSAA